MHVVNIFASDILPAMLTNSLLPFYDLSMLSIYKAIGLNLAWITETEIGHIERGEGG